MGDVVTLSRFRKQKQKQEKQAEAALNRAKFGRNRSEKAAESSEALRRGRELEGHKLEFGTIDDQS
jgi:hypothetical protein